MIDALELDLERVTAIATASGRSRPSGDSSSPWIRRS